MLISFLVQQGCNWKHLYQAVALNGETRLPPVSSRNIRQRAWKRNNMVPRSPCELFVGHTIWHGTITLCPLLCGLATGGLFMMMQMQEVLCS